MKEFSFYGNSRVEQVQSRASPSVSIRKICAVNFSDIKGYVAVKYDSHWWLGCVLQTYPEVCEAKVIFLHPHGQARSFKYPQHPDILTVLCKDILTTGLQSLTSTGHTYTLKQEETRRTTEVLIIK